MDWFKVLAAAVAGGAAAIAGNLFFRKTNKKGLAYAAVVIATFFVIYGFLRGYILPDLREWNEARTLESKVLERPVFQALKQYAPEVYEDLLAEAETAILNGADASEMIRIGKSYLAPLITQKLPYASDAATIRCMKVTMAQLSELNKHPGDLGYRFLYPDPSEPLNLTPYLSEGLLEEEQLAMAEVLKTATENPQEIPDESEVLQHLDYVWVELAEEYGDDLSMLDNPTDPGVDKAKVCSMVAALYDKVLSLPEAESGRVLRFMMSP